MVRFSFMKSDVRTGSLTAKERRELQRLEKHAGREKEEKKHALEIVTKAREMRQEQSKHKGGSRLIVLLLIAAALVYAYIKYFRSG